MNQVLTGNLLCVYGFGGGIKTGAHVAQAVV